MKTIASNRQISRNMLSVASYGTVKFIFSAIKERRGNLNAKG